MQVGAGAFEEWIDGEARSFDTFNFDDLIDLARKETLLTLFVGARSSAVNHDVDLAQPVKCLLGGDVCAGGEGEAREVAESVVGAFAVDAGHAGVSSRERPEHRHRFRATAFADKDATRV